MCKSYKFGTLVRDGKMNYGIAERLKKINGNKKLPWLLWLSDLQATAYKQEVTISGSLYCWREYHRKGLTPEMALAEFKASCNWLQNPPSLEGLIMDNEDPESSESSDAVVVLYAIVFIGFFLFVLAASLVALFLSLL